MDVISPTYRGLVRKCHSKIFVFNRGYNKRVFYTISCCESDGLGVILF